VTKKSSVPRLRARLPTTKEDESELVICLAPLKGLYYILYNLPRDVAVRDFQLLTTVRKSIQIYDFSVHPCVARQNVSRDSVTRIIMLSKI
jgi:hypothetical protein